MPHRKTHPRKKGGKGIPYWEWETYQDTLDLGGRYVVNNLRLVIDQLRSEGKSSAEVLAKVYVILEQMQESIDGRLNSD